MGLQQPLSRTKTLGHGDSMGQLLPGPGEAAWCSCWVSSLLSVLPGFVFAPGPVAVDAACWGGRRVCCGWQCLVSAFLGGCSMNMWQVCQYSVGTAVGAYGRTGADEREPIYSNSGMLPLCLGLWEWLAFCSPFAFVWASGSRLAPGLSLRAHKP